MPIIFEEPHTLLRTISNLATIIGLATIIIAWWQYRKNQLDNRRQILKVLKSQLKISKIWAGTRGPGYTGDPLEKAKIERANPFYSVLAIENTPTTIVLGIKEIASFGDNFIDSLLEYNQTIQNMKNVQIMRDRIAFSNIKLTINIYKAVTTFLKNYNNETFEDFLTNSNFSDEEKILAERLSDINIKLHWKFIGTVGGDGLHETQKNLEKEVELAEARLEGVRFQ